MRHKAIAGEIHIYPVSYSPFLGEFKVDRGSTVVFHKPKHHFLIFLAIESAGAVKEDATRFQRVPHGSENLTLACGTLLHERGSPLSHSLFVLAHHPFAAAWHIGGYNVEEMGESAESTTIVACNHAAGSTPFDNILAQHLSAGAHNLVCYHKRAVGKRVDSGRGLAARCCT